MVHVRSFLEALRDQHPGIPLRCVPLKYGELTHLIAAILEDPDTGRGWHRHLSKEICKFVTTQLPPSDADSRQTTMANFRLIVNRFGILSLRNEDIAACFDIDNAQGSDDTPRPAKRQRSVVATDVGPWATGASRTSADDAPCVTPRKPRTAAMPRSSEKHTAIPGMDDRLRRIESLCDRDLRVAHIAFEDELEQEHKKTAELEKTVKRQAAKLTELENTMAEMSSELKVFKRLSSYRVSQSTTGWLTKWGGYNCAHKRALSHAGAVVFCWL